MKISVYIREFMHYICVLTKVFVIFQAPKAPKAPKAKAAKAPKAKKE
jgi:hypothetical protein